MEDGEIVNLIYNRDETGLESLKKKYEHLIYKVSMSILNNKNDSMECINDTYLKIWKSIPPYKPMFLKSFVCKIVRQISIDKYRVNAKNIKRNVSLLDIDYEISSSYDMDDEMYKKELSRLIDVFLENLDIVTQILFIRKYFLNESVKSLAERFNLSETYISVKMLRLKKNLKKYLQKEGYKIEKN